MTSGNPIFDKNLECIEKYNPKLKKQLLELNDFSSRFEINETEKGEPNFIFNGIPLHNPSGAEEEASDIFSKTDNTKLSRHIIFGMGLGYLFKEACEKSKGIVFLIEQDLEILRVTLEIVDFSKELSQKNVFVVSDINAFFELFSVTYLDKACTSFLSLNSYNNILYRKSLEDIKTRLTTIVTSSIIKQNTAKVNVTTFSAMIFENLEKILENTTPLEAIKDVYKDKTAVVVSAGPTLDDSIAAIKKYRDNIIVISIGQAFKALMKNGITPDFANVVEVQDCTGQFYGYDTSQINLITNTVTHKNLYNMNVKRQFIFPSFNQKLNIYLSKILGYDYTLYEEQGTVSYSALVTAKILGCSKIIIAGQDFAYLENKCYSKDSAYGDVVYDIDPETNKPIIKLKDKENFIKSWSASEDPKQNKKIASIADEKVSFTQKHMVYVDGIQGNKLPTLPGYACFLEFFNYFGEFNSKEIELINTSMKGALIRGFKNMTMEDALKESSKIERIDKFTPFKFDRKEIVKKLNEGKDSLVALLTDFNRAEALIKDYQKEFMLNGKITKPGVKKIQDLLAIYEKIEVKTQSNELYGGLSYVEVFEITSLLRATETFTIKETEELYSLLKEYFVSNKKRITNAIEKIEALEKKPVTTNA